MKRSREVRGVPVFGAVFLLVLALTVSFGLLLFMGLVRSLSSGDGIAVARQAVFGDLVSLTLAQVGGMGLALWLGLRMFREEASLAEALRLGPVRLRTVALCLLAGAALQFPLSELANLLHEHVFGPESLEQQLALQKLMEASSLGRGVAVVICLVGVIPLTEELLFRGLFAFGLAERHGRAFAILVSSLLFGLAHLDATTAVYAAAAGLLLAPVALFSGSIWSSLSVHAAVNAMPVLLPERLVPIPGFNVISELPLHQPLQLSIGGLVVGALLLALALRIEYAADA